MCEEPCILPFQRSTLYPTKTLTTNHCVLRYNAGLPESYVARLLTDQAAVFAEGKLLRSTGMRAAALIHLDSRPYIIKHYYKRTLRQTINQAMTGLEAIKAYELGCRLADEGIRTPRPIACLENHKHGRHVDSYLLYPYVDGQTLRKMINRGVMTDAEIMQARLQLDDIWARLRAAKVGLKDANSGNFIVDPQGIVWLIDLDGSRIHRTALAADIRLKLSWRQITRSVQRAMRDRDRGIHTLRRAA